MLFKLIHFMFRSIFPMPSEARLRIDFRRILRAMGEDSEQENHLKPYENNSLIFYVLSSTFRNLKPKVRSARRRPGNRSAADAATLYIDISSLCSPFSLNYRHRVLPFPSGNSLKPLSLRGAAGSTAPAATTGRAV